jgi:hypothetical protein
MASSDPKSPVQGFKRPRVGKVASDVADWTSCTPGKLVDLIANCARKGGAIRLGYTRDGGAYSIGVYVGGDYFTDYLRPDEDLDEYIEQLAESFNQYTPAVSDPPEKRKSKK